MLQTSKMPQAANEWPSNNTRDLIAGKYERLFNQCKALWLAVTINHAARKALRFMGIV